MNTSIYDSMNNFIPTGNVCMAGAGEAIPDAEVLNGRCVAFKVHEGVLKEIAEASGAEAVRYVGAYEDGHARLLSVDTDAAARGELPDMENGTATTSLTVYEFNSFDTTFSETIDLNYESSVCTLSS